MTYKGARTVSVTRAGIIPEGERRYDQPIEPAPGDSGGEIPIVTSKLTVGVLDEILALLPRTGGAGEDYIVVDPTGDGDWHHVECIHLPFYANRDHSDHQAFTITLGERVDTRDF